MSQQRKCSAEFKAKVALEALSGELTLAETDKDPVALVAGRRQVVFAQRRGLSQRKGVCAVFRFPIDAWLCVAHQTPVLRSDNGLIFQSRRFRLACRDYRLRQKYITPYTPEQYGMIERIFRSLKEECVWQRRFRTFVEAKRAICRRIEWHNSGRPHQALGYLSPAAYRAQKLQIDLPKTLFNFSTSMPTASSL